jgi:hypothetical protein
MGVPVHFDERDPNSVTFDSLHRRRIATAPPTATTIPTIATVTPGPSVPPPSIVSLNSTGSVVEAVLSSLGFVVDPGLVVFASPSPPGSWVGVSLGVGGS